LPTEGAWIDFWTNKTYKAGDLISKIYPLDKFPLFVKSGAIIPITNVYSNEQKGYTNQTTILIYPNGKTEKELHLPKGEGTEYENCFVRYDEENRKLQVVSNGNQTYTIILKNISQVKNIKPNLLWEYDTKKSELIIKNIGPKTNLIIQ
jgi:alpha-glucosidase (family GH31 glycosyl hydrolase)